MRVWVNGTFDILHYGHIALLTFASKIGAVRVGLDSDNRVRARKGQNRPINNLQDRMRVLNALKSVKDTVSFDTDEELKTRILDYAPDYIVVGSEYEGKVIGQEYAEIIYFSRIEPYSTTRIIEKIGNE